LTLEEGVKEDFGGCKTWKERVEDKIIKFKLLREDAQETIVTTLYHELWRSGIQGNHHLTHASTDTRPVKLL